MRNRGEGVTPAPALFQIAAFEFIDPPRNPAETAISGFRPAVPKPSRLPSSSYMIVMWGPKLKVPVIALLAPVWKDLQQRARHSLYDSPSVGFVHQMAAAPWTALLLARTH